jgi:hypothetical protein
MLYILTAVYAAATLRRGHPGLTAETFSLRRSTKSNKLPKQAKNLLSATPATCLSSRFRVVFALKNGSAIIIFNSCEDGVITANHACSEFESKALCSRTLCFTINARFLRRNHSDSSSQKYQKQQHFVGSPRYMTYLV